MAEDYFHELQDSLAGKNHTLSSYVDELCAKAIEWNEWYKEGGLNEFLATKDDEALNDSIIGDFEDYELVLAAILLSAWVNKSEPAYGTALDILGDTYDPARMEKAMDTIQAELSDLYGAGSTEQIKKNLEQAAKRGGSLGRIVGSLNDLPRYKSVLEGMVDSAKYFGNQYFETQVLPKLYETVEDAIQTGLPTGNTVFRQIQEALDQRLLKRTPYWHTHASASASRAYHYGLIRAGQTNGYRGYRLVAVLDNRTSDVCTTLHGREFWLADAAEIYERVANSDAGQVAQEHPWIVGEELKGLTEHQVFDRATYVPPFHGRCRTTMQLIVF